EELDLMRCSTLLEDSRTAHLTLDAATLQPPISQALVRLVTRLAAAPSDLALLQTLTDTMRQVSTLPFSVELWKVQNVFYTLCHTAYPAFRQSAAQGDPQARLWIHHLRALGDLLIRHERGETIDMAEFRRQIEAAVQRVVVKQLEVGIDIGNNGEQPRVGFQTYVASRMQGFGGASARPASMDVREFPDYGVML